MHFSKVLKTFSRIMKNKDKKSLNSAVLNLSQDEVINMLNWFSRWLTIFRLLRGNQGIAQPAKIYIVHFCQYMVHSCQYMVHFCHYMVHFCQYMVHFCQYMVHFCQYMVHFCQYMVHFCQRFYQNFDSYWDKYMHWQN